MIERGRDRFEPPRLYAIADAGFLGDSLVESVAIMAGEGLEWIQLRFKNSTDEQAFRLTEACLERLQGSSAHLWINDRVDLAAITDSFGVHLGQRDLSPKAARKVLGPKPLIGWSTHGVGQAEQAERDESVDVVAIGPIFPTTTKANPDSVVGLRGLTRVREVVTKPLVAIGGINAESIPSVLDCGADSVVVLSALGRKNLRSTLRQVMQSLR